MYSVPNLGYYSSIEKKEILELGLLHPSYASTYTSKTTPSLWAQLGLRIAWV